MVVGSLTGALCGGIQSGKFGRKKSLMFDNVVFLVGILILCLAPNFYLILLARFITGHSTASALVAAPIYASEISQPQTRKIIGSFQLMCFTSGFALSFVLGKYQFYIQLVYKPHLRIPMHFTVWAVMAVVSKKILNSAQRRYF